VLGAGLVLVVSACGGGEKNTHYTYANSVGCFKGLGLTQVMDRKNNAVRITSGQSKIFDVLFLPSGAQAEAYTKRFNVPGSGILRAKGNVMVYGHLLGPGPDISDDDIDRVEECLA
jgi:hypothetical protein